MRGRTEIDNKIEQKIKLKLQSQPEVLTEYYYSINGKTSTTKRAYINYVIEFFDYMKNDLGLDADDVCSFKHLRTLHINKYMDVIKRGTESGKEISASLRAAKMFGISNFFKFLVQNEYIDTNICENVEFPKVNEEKGIVALTPEEIKHIEDNIISGVGDKDDVRKQKKWMTRNIAIFKLGCSTGLRVSAISQINIEDCDFENKKITVVEKGNKTRDVYLGSNVVDSILNWLEDRDEILNGKECSALFINHRRSRISVDTIERMIKLYSYDIGKRITPHKMRSSCATNLYEQTGDIYLVQQVLGHKNISNTQKYAKFSEEKQRQAANIMNDILND